MTTRSRSRLASVLAALAFAACSPAGKQAGTPQTSSNGLRGYGVPGVDGPNLEAMLGRCEAVERLPPQDLSAIEGQDLLRRCAQLRRTMGTQPGNSVRAGP